MRRRLLAWCLLAYPRECRERDRDHLLDLATELSESNGVVVEGFSLLRGGLAARWTGRHRRRPIRLRIAAACLVAVCAVGVGTVAVMNEEVRVEVETTDRAVGR